MQLLSLMILAFLSTLFPVLADAGSFTVSPVRVELSPAKPLSSVTITNDGDEAVKLEVEGKLWTQKDGADDYQDTRELIVTPPVITLAAKASQIIRLGLRRGADPKNELSYRLFITEIRPQVKTEGTGVTMNLRLSVPIFVKPTAAVNPQLQWTAKKVEGGNLLLRAENTGNIHMQVANLQLSAGTDVVGKESSAAYLLPGQAHEWTVKPETGKTFNASTLSLTGFCDAGDLKVNLTVQ
jgi:fimbrial chaperone protein